MADLWESGHQKQITVYGAAAAWHRALTSSPRDLHRRHACIDCMVRNPDGVDCKVNEVGQAPSPGCLGN